jgi:hypothetical protein
MAKRAQRARGRSGTAKLKPITKRALTEGVAVADLEQLAHNNTYGLLPRFYVDKVVRCRNCSKEEIWRATQQKWWYEVAKGNINSEAVLCRACRALKRAQKDAARKVHMEGVARKRARSQRSGG